MQFMLAAFVCGKTGESKWNNFVEAIVITVLIDRCVCVSTKNPTMEGRQLMSCDSSTSQRFLGRTSS